MDLTNKSSKSRGSLTDKDEASCYAIQSIVQTSHKGRSVGNLLRAQTDRKTSHCTKQRSEIPVDFTGTDFSDPKTVFHVDKSKEKQANVLRFCARGKNYYLGVTDGGKVKLYKLVQFPTNNKYFFHIERINRGLESPFAFRSFKTKEYLHCDENGKAFMGNAGTNGQPTDRQAWFTFIAHKGYILSDANGSGVEAEDGKVDIDIEDRNSEDSGRGNSDILESDEEHCEHSELIIYVSAL